MEGEKKEKHKNLEKDLSLQSTPRLVVKYNFLYDQKRSENEEHEFLLIREILYDRDRTKEKQKAS